MTTADQLAIVSQTLIRGSNEVPLVLADGGLVKDWLKCRRLLVVIESRCESTTSQALFIYNAHTLPVTNVQDLDLEIVLPIDQDFKCVIDSGEATLIIKISSVGRSPLLFEMLPGYHTQNFVGEIYRLTDVTSTQAKKGTTLKSFAWLDKYHESIKAGSDVKNEANFKRDDPISSLTTSISQTSLGDSPESSLNRQDIAMGLTPIAARESVVKYQMALKEEQFTEIQHFTIFAATWNVKGLSPSGSLAEWLATDAEPPDVYAIGFQELDLSKEAFIFTESPKEEEWQNAVSVSLHPKAKYKKVKLVRLVGMMLIVYAKETHMSYIGNVSAEYVGTGIMGMLGNKGGVAIRFEFHNTTICFVNSHLAAHVSEFERRNQDFHEICNRMIFHQLVPAVSIKDHDMIYWIGDLNYRITDLDLEMVKENIREKKLEELYKADQLRQQIYRRKVFTGYSEGKLSFPPTYKYDPGTDNWDSSEKARAPAWTDRILWKGDHIEQSAYRSHMELKISDHKPVSAVFKSGMKVIDPQKYRRIYEEVMKKLDKLENEFLPQVTVDSTEINFEMVGFIEQATRTLTVANTGQVPVQFEFIKKLNDKSFCKSWLSVEPSSGFIMPGDKSDLTLEVCVDKKTAGSLNSGSDQLYDILVLHLVGGKDIFVTISGSYRKSSFGASIEALCRLTVPIAELSSGAVIDLEKMSSNDQLDGVNKVDPYPVPKELWFLCDLITSLGMHHEQLFLQPGLRAEIIAIRDWLDTGLPVDKPTVSIHSAAESLLLFLQSLRDPVIPFSAYAQCLECSNNYLQCKQIISQLLPTHHRHVFDYVCAFLREVIRFSAQNGVDSKILATLFARILLRDPPGTNLGTGIRARTQQQLLDQKKARFIYHFLVNDPEID